MNGHGHECGHEFMSESMSEADSDMDMRLFGTSDTDTDMDKVMTSDTDTGSDTHRSANLGHEFGLGHVFGHAFGHAFRHDVRILKISLFLIRSKFLVGRDSRSGSVQWISHTILPIGHFTNLHNGPEIRLTLISQQVRFLEKFHSKLEKFHSNLEKFHSKLRKFHSNFVKIIRPFSNS